MIHKLFSRRSEHPLADGKELARILAELRVETPAKAVDEVMSWFESLQHGDDFRLPQYFQMVRQLDEAAQPHLRRLARDYLHAGGGSALVEQRLWAASRGYWAAVAAQYTACIERARLDPKSSDAFKALLPLAVARVQAARCMQLKWQAYRYGPVDDLLWKELATTYLAAEAAGHAQQPMQLYPAQKALTSVAQQYVHANVFFSSSMDSLTPLQIELADRLIAYFLPGFVFSADCRQDSVYWLDAASGSAPVRLARHPGAQRPGLRFLSPGTARQALDELIHVVERGDVPDDLNLGGQYPQRVLLPVLYHLRAHWAVRPPQRRHQRHVVKTRMTVLHGFEHSHAVFSGSRPPLPVEPDSETWLVENVSLGGFRALVDDSSGQTLKLGELLCMQPEGGDNWLLGASRRFNRLAGERASLGIQVLSRRARSIDLRPRQSGFSAAVRILGIWLHDSGESGVLRIVLLTGGFNVQVPVEFSDDGRRHLLTPLELEESGGDYEIGRFRDQAIA